MSASFYYNIAVMMGVDEHHAQLLSPKLSDIATGKTEKPWKYVVNVVLAWPFGDDAKRTSNVTADGQKMIRDGFKVGKVPHVPLPGPFHRYQAVENVKIIASSSTRPLLKMQSVTSAGDPLSVCAAGPVGPQINCWDDEEKLSGIVISPCTVVTSPSLKDLIYRIFDDYLKKWLVEKIIDLLVELIARRLRIPRPIVKWILKKLVPKIVDWVEEQSKKLYDHVEKKPDIVDWTKKKAKDVEDKLKKLPEKAREAEDKVKQKAKDAWDWASKPFAEGPGDPKPKPP